MYTSCSLQCRRAFTLLLLQGPGPEQLLQARQCALRARFLFSFYTTALCALRASFPQTEGAIMGPGMAA
jgi:hypothetical protein